MRRRLEAINLNQAVLCVSQVLVDAVQIFTYNVIVILVLLAFKVTPQYSDWRMYVAVLLESLSHSMLL